MTTAPIRNVYTAIELIMTGRTFASFRDRIDIRMDSLIGWHFALAGAINVLKHSNLQSTLAEMQSLADYVDSL
jgi:aromatic ring hydroxylase